MGQVQKESKVSYRKKSSTPGKVQSREVLENIERSNHGSVLREGGRTSREITGQRKKFDAGGGYIL